jgi:perosamine synthetase
MNDFIPVNEPLLKGKEKQYLNECIDTGWISSEGPFVEKFEQAFAASVGRTHAISVCNGSMALDAAIVALGIGHGDEVILPTFTIISCGAAIVRAGAIPVVVDCEPTTWNMDVDQVEDKITLKTKAIMIVHIYGLPVNMTPLLQLAEQYGLKIIEDAAEMHGQTYRGKPCGSFGDISTFSFYSNKHITTGEGGMIVTNRPEIAQSCRSLRNLCFQPQRRFVHEALGWNLRMTNMQAAVGLAQLEQLDGFIARKRQMGRRYSELLQDIPGLQLPLAETDYAENIYWVYGIVLKDEIPFDAAEVIERLKAHQIGTRPFFWCMHEQPVFQKMGLLQGISCPVAENLARRGFYLPSGLALTPEHIERVAESMHKIFVGKS